MTGEAFTRHYTAVADASPVPVLLYNVTMFTGVNLPVEAVAALAAHPNIVGMKESGSESAQIAEYVARTPDDFTVLAGSATTYLPCALRRLRRRHPGAGVALPRRVRPAADARPRQPGRTGARAAAPPDADRAHHRHRARRAGAQGRARPARLCRRTAAAAAAARAGRGRRDAARASSRRSRRCPWFTAGLKLLTAGLKPRPTYVVNTDPTRKRFSPRCPFRPPNVFCSAPARASSPRASCAPWPRPCSAISTPTSCRCSTTCALSLRRLFKADEQALTIATSGTGTSAMEAAVANVGVRGHSRDRGRLGLLRRAPGADHGALRRHACAASTWSGAARSIRRCCGPS